MKVSMISTPSHQSQCDIKSLMSLMLQKQSTRGIINKQVLLAIEFVCVSIMS